MSAPFDLLGSELPKDTMLLEASAGTGKTFTITGIVLRLLLEGQIKQLSQVLVVTFTNAATQELKARIRKALAKAADACERGTSSDPTYRELGERHGAEGAKILRTALQQCDEMSVATIHSFCKRVLEESAFSASMPFRTEFVDDATHQLDLMRTGVERKRAADVDKAALHLQAIVDAELTGSK